MHSLSWALRELWYFLPPPPLPILLGLKGARFTPGYRGPREPIYCHRESRRAGPAILFACEKNLRCEDNYEPTATQQSTKYTENAWADIRGVHGPGVALRVAIKWVLGHPYNLRRLQMDFGPTGTAKRGDRANPGPPVEICISAPESQAILLMINEK